MDSGLIIGGIVVAVAIIVVLVVHLKLYRQYHYVCVQCRTAYKPASFLQSLFGLNGGDQRKLKCPQCNKREWADTVKDA